MEAQAVVVAADVTEAPVQRVPFVMLNRPGSGGCLQRDEIRPFFDLGYGWPPISVRIGFESALGILTARPWTGYETKGPF